MPRSAAALRARPGRGAACALLRACAAVLLAAAVVACCPAPLVPTAGTPTAFVAVVADVDGTSWVANAPGGARLRVAGAPPAATGDRVYVTGALAADGSLVIERVVPVAIR